ncbi:MAG: transposase [Erysipelotrichaceae bacterium]|nr:transposase [Erysipelotrichaceae bacterium]
MVESSYDNEARTGDKTADTNFFGYKTHIATTEDGIAVAAVVTSGEKTDGQYLEQLVKMANEAGMEVKEVIADKANSSRENIDNMNAQGIQVVSRLSSSLINGKRTDNKGFEFNKDAQMYQCPVGELAVRKAKTFSERIKEPTHLKQMEFEASDEF